MRQVPQGAAAEQLRLHAEGKLLPVMVPRVPAGESFLDRLGPMFVGTIHSYCFRLLQDHVPCFGNYDVLDENRLAVLLSIDHLGMGLSAWYYLCGAADTP